MSDRAVINRVVMVQSVAAAWIATHARPEYRVQIFLDQDRRKFASLLKSFRDGRLKIAGVDPLTDMGVTEQSDTVTLWSSNRTALLQLVDWFESKGFDNSGLW